jgi:hypothetical protein
MGDTAYQRFPIASRRHPWEAYHSERLVIYDLFECLPLNLQL